MTKPVTLLKKREMLREVITQHEANGWIGISGIDDEDHVLMIRESPMGTGAIYIKTITVDYNRTTLNVQDITVQEHLRELLAEALHQEEA